MIIVFKEKKTVPVIDRNLRYLKKKKPTYDSFAPPHWSGEHAICQTWYATLLS